MSAGQVPLYSCDIKYEISGKEKLYDLLKRIFCIYWNISQRNLCAEHRRTRSSKSVKKTKSRDREKVVVKSAQISLRQEWTFPLNVYTVP